MFKIAIDAGHGLGTPGKRIPKELDPSQTREWTLNDRVARYIAEAAKEYCDVEFIRVDDTTGKTDVSLSDRCKKANNWGADMYMSVHHNAAGKVFSGGGIVAYSYKEGTKGAEYRDAIYKACINAGGIKGNRSDPLHAKNFYVLRCTNAPAVLMEYGFMDSTVDAPIILTEEYAKNMGYATMEGIAKVAGLKKAEPAPTPEVNDGVCNISTRILARGHKGDDVESMQILLLGKGFEMKNGKKTYGADGSFGAATENAVKNFQKSVGLPQSGICGADEWEKLLGL